MGLAFGWSGGVFMRSLILSALVILAFLFAHAARAATDGSENSWGLCESLAGYAGLRAVDTSPATLCWVTDVAAVKVYSRYDVMIECRGGDYFYAIVRTAFRSIFSCDVQDVQFHKEN
jgi:hypothetical protein